MTLHRSWDSEVFVLSADTRAGLVAAGERLLRFLAADESVAGVDLAYTLNCPAPTGAEFSLAIVADSPRDLDRKLAHAVERVADPRCSRIKERSGVYFFEDPLVREGSVGFLFPGEGAQYLGMLADLCIHFPGVRRWFDLIDRAFAGHEREYLPSEVVFPPPGRSKAEAEARLWQMDAGTEAVFTANQALLDLVTQLQIAPAAVAGHSTGDYSALWAAGALHVDSDEQLAHHALALNGIYESLLRGGEIADGPLLTVGASDRDAILQVLERSDGRLSIALDNCPHQLVVHGSEEAIEQAIPELKSCGAICNRLPFDRAYHTPRFAPFADALETFFADLEIVPPAMPLYSCATAARYPDDPGEIRRLAREQWALPVRFRETIESMYADGVRIFVEVGPRGNLTSFVDDILRGRPYLAVPANVTHRSGVEQLNHLAGLLAAHHVPMRLEALYEHRSPRTILLDPSAAPDPSSREAEKMHVPGALPLLALEPEQARRLSVAARSPETGRTVEHTDAVAPSRSDAAGSEEAGIAAYMKTMDSFLSVQQNVMKALLGRPQTAHVPRPAQTVAAPSASNGEVKAEAPAASQAAPAAEQPAGIEDVLLRLVSERTGYPAEMLDPALDLEADLGIDSIKRVEIFGALERETGQSQDLERLAGLRTLEQIVACYSAPARNGAADSPAAAPARSPQIGSFPLLGTVVAHAEGRELVVRRRLDLEEDVFLRDHTLGGRVSATDADLLALPVVPLTISMEILAEAAAALAPDQLVVGMREVRAHRWIALDDGAVELQVEARRADAAGTEVEVRLSRAPTDAGSNGDMRPAIVEATVVLADTYPDPAVAGEFPLRAERPSKWEREQLYAEGMFHGPAFRGVASVDRWGEDGTEATLEALPADGLFRATPSPRFVTDPVLLDAAGQLVGYWAAEHLESGFNVFPYRVEAVELYGPTLPAGAGATCRARIASIGDRQLRSDIDVVRPDGRLHARLIGWEDRQFDLPRGFYRLRVEPERGMASQQWSTVLAGLPAADQLTCCLVDDLTDDLLTAHSGIWGRVLAHLVLGRSEREQLQGLAAADARRNDWVRGRTAAKDAVRLLVHARAGRDVYAPDVEIGRDQAGQPVVRGAFTEAVTAPPVVSIAHCAGVAAAVAGDGDLAGVGIDIEPVGRTLSPDAARRAFTPEEHRLLATLEGDPDEWRLRLWCAKESAGKALGQGLSGNPASLVAARIDAASGTFEVAPNTELADRFPALPRASLTVSTVQDRGLVAAVCVRPRS